MKKNRNTQDKFVYPHPIIKTFTSIPQETHHHAPFAYQNFHTSDSNSISHKLLRSTHINPLLGSSFSLLLHPFHPKIEISSYESKDVLHCRRCQSVLNSDSIKKLSLLQHKCKYCGQVSESQFDTGRYVDLNALDRVDESQKYQQSINKSPKILFVLQANQFLFNKEIHTSIFQCLRALSPELEVPLLNKSISVQTDKSQGEEDKLQASRKIEWATNLRVGFMFYDDQRNYLMNLQTNQLVVIQQSHFENQNQFPLTQNQILHSLRQLNLQQLQATVKQIMYSSFQMKVGCLLNTLKICDMLAKMWEVQTKMFMCSYDCNVLEKKTNKQTNDNKKVSKTKVNISSRIQISLVNAAIYSYMINLGLGANINKFYNYNTVSATDIYYDLYHNLTQQIHYDTEIEVSTSQLLVCNRSKIKSSVLTSNTPLILDFHIPYNSASSKKIRTSTLQFEQLLNNQSIQIRIKLNNHSTRVITYSVPTIKTFHDHQPYLLNDQTFFYVMVYKMLNDKSIHSMKKAIVAKSKQIINRIIQCEEGNFVIPKNLTNFFMYSFMISHYQIYQRKNADYLHEKTLFMREGLQTVAKKIYPKVYEFYPQIKPMKYKPKSFLHDGIKLVDNGQFIGIVVGDEVKPNTLNQTFGVKDIDDAIDWKEIPNLNTAINQKLHTAIELLRQLNQMYYLPIKIIRFDSHEYEELYGNYLYIEQDHRKFFMNCLKN